MSHKDFAVELMVISSILGMDQSIWMKMLKVFARRLVCTQILFYYILFINFQFVFALQGYPRLHYISPSNLRSLLLLSSLQLRDLCPYDSE